MKVREEVCGGPKTVHYTPLGETEEESEVEEEEMMRQAQELPVFLLTG